MTVLLNSNLLPIISVAMYNTQLDASNIFDDYTINDDLKEGYINFNSEFYWNNFQNDLYTEKIESLASEFLNGKHTFNGIDLTFKCGLIYSPKYYNFANDNIDINVTFNKTKVLKYAKDNKDSFDTFLHKNYSIYDGFLSHTANSFDEWLTDFKENNEQSIGEVLMFICSSQIENYQNDFIYYCFENLCFIDFVDTTKIDAEALIVENYVKENYLNIDFNNLSSLKDKFDFEFLDSETFLKIVNKTISNIENNTLKLKLCK